MARSAATFLLCLISSFQLRADTVLLSDGQLLEGKYLGDDGTFIELEQGSKTVRLESARVARVELAYPGVPICFRRKGSPDRLCQGKLFLLYGDSAEIIGGPGDTRKERVNISDLSDMEFQRTSEGQLVIPRVKAGARVRIVLPEGSVQGRVEAANPEALTIRDAENRSIQVREERIQQLQLPSEQRFMWSRLVPGLPQFRRGERRRAFVLWSVMGGLALGALFEQRAAQQEVLRARGNFLYISSGLGSRESVFQNHAKNAKILGAGLVLAYGFHLTDEFYLSARSSPHRAELGLTLPLP